MKKILVIALLSGSFSTIAQSTFKKGYFITAENKKTEGYFKTFGSDLPEKITFKESNDSEIYEEIDSKSLKELSFGEIKYVKKEVQFEVLDKNMLAKKGSNTEKFKLVRKSLLLKKDLESEKLNLYSVKYLDNIYFFYEIDSQIELLKYKLITTDNKKIKIKEYRKQLFKNFKLKSKRNLGRLGKVKYNYKNIAEYLKLYFRENNYTYTEYLNYYNLRDFKDAFDIEMLGGFSLMKQKNKNDFTIYETTHKTYHINLGLNVEYFFNTIDKKTSITSSLAYNLNNNSDNQNYSFGSGNPNYAVVKNNLSFLTIDIKYRKYFKFSNEGYVFLNGGLGASLSSGNTSYVRNDNNVFLSNLNDDSLNMFFVVGTGFSYKRFRVNINYIPSFNGDFNILEENTSNRNWAFERSILSFSFGYNLI